jgi:glycosyltransferase involved in cell wall biosynthesis
MGKINLLYVITKLELGGAQKQLLSLISHLDRQKFSPFLFTAQGGLLLTEALSIKDLNLKHSKCLERSISPIKDLLALFEIYRFIKKNNIQVVHTHSSKAGILGRLAARLARVRLIIHTVHGWSFNDYQPELLRYILIWLERLTARFSDKLIVSNYPDKQKGLSNRIGSDEQYVIIRYGLNYADFLQKDPKIKEELGINNGDLVVGMVSCLKPQKSPLDFIKLAFMVNQILPKVKFILVGDGILRRRAEQLIEKLNIKGCSTLAGWRRDVHRILSAIDVFVLTSLWEGLPISALEAMAASKPVVATNTGGVQDVVTEGKTGFLVPPKDIRLMSERIVALLQDEGLRRQIGENAKNNLGREFSLAGMVKDTQDLYYSLLTARN